MYIHDQALEEEPAAMPTLPGYTMPTTSWHALTVEGHLASIYREIEKSAYYSDNHYPKLQV